MAKPAVKLSNRNLNGVDGSTFTLTFAIEVLGIDVWHDCNEGWLDLGSCAQGLKIQYQLYPGQNYDIDVQIWPHVAKIWSGMNSGWVRTWQFLDRRWLAFDIRHIFPVRVAELKEFVATVTPTFGVGALSTNAKNDKVTEVYLPRLEFGQQRYFAPVMSEEISLDKFLYDLIWKTVEGYIPVSYLDGLFDVPHPVADVRHQDVVLYHVKESILSRNLIEEPDREMSNLDKKSLANTKQKKIEVVKIKFEIYLSGNSILAGVGRQVPFETVGDRPPDQGEFFVFVSSQNLPASEDLSIFFVNIGSVLEVPLEALKKYQISHIYTKWSVAEEIHESEQQAIGSKTAYNFNDHHAVPLPREVAFKVICGLMDDDFQIELRGIRQPPNPNANPQFFGYDKKDRVFGAYCPPIVKNYETDIIIAVTKIDTRSLAKGVSGVVQGDFALLPPKFTVESLGRDTFCTNDQNGVRLPVNPVQVIPSYVILDAQMTLEVRMGYAGCTPQRMERTYSRMICLITDTWLIMEMLKLVSEINYDLEENEMYDAVLTGFAVDTGKKVIFYIEGPQDGAILQLWQKTGDYYPNTIPMFSSSARYSSRIYHDATFAGNVMLPFMVMKMYAPLSAILACPPVYARPALPILARFATLKFGRLLATRRWWRLGPPTSELPTLAELISFRQELCLAPRPPNAMKQMKTSPSTDNEHLELQPKGKTSTASSNKITTRSNQTNQSTNSNITERSLISKNLVDNKAPCNDVLSEPFSAEKQDAISIWTPQTRQIVSYHSQGKRTLILMRGLPGSGKSFLAKELVKTMCPGAKYSTHIFGTDEFFIPIGQWLESRAQEAHNWNKDRVRNAIDRGVSPIFVDTTNIEIWEMEPYVKAGVSNGYIIEVLEPNTPWGKSVEEATRRNSHNVSICKIRWMQDRFSEKNINGDYVIQKLGLSYPPGKVPPVIRNIPAFPDPQ